MPTIPAPHRLVAMAGRDPHERHRVSTPLELLYDLTFAVAFGIAGNELAHYLAAGHVAAGLGGFALSTFAICWTWINFSWFASAFDTDDWAYRIAVMVQMIGVVILALGLPAMYASVDAGGTVDNATMVLGYIVRLAMIALWLRAARQCPAQRRTCYTYAASLVIAQIGWIVLLRARMSVWGFAAVGLVLMVVELGGPFIAETRKGDTPWHPHHIAERYSLLTIITLGEGVIGTVASLTAILELADGWTLDAIVLAFSGIALTFALWWMYFSVDPVPVLEKARERSFGWGYGHLLVFPGIAGTGAGLHVAAYYLEHQAEIPAWMVVLSVVGPVALFTLTIFGLYVVLYRTADALHLIMLALTAAFLALPVLMAQRGVGVPWCLLALVLAPLVSVVGYELWGHAHQQRAASTL